jgi:hypothetical protein
MPKLPYYLLTSHSAIGYVGSNMTTPYFRSHHQDRGPHPSMSSSRVQSHRVGQSSEHVTCQGIKVPVYDMCIHTRAWHPTLINLATHINLQQPTDFEVEWNMNSQPLFVWFSKLASQHDSCKILTSKNSTDCRNLSIFGLSLINSCITLLTLDLNFSLTLIKRGPKTANS